jgi:hypothetical protein
MIAKCVEPQYELKEAFKNIDNAMKVLQFITDTQTKALQDYRTIVVDLHSVKFNILNWKVEHLLFVLGTISFKHCLLQRYLEGQKYLTWNICCNSLNYKPLFVYDFPKTIKNKTIEIHNENVWLPNVIDMWYKDIDFPTKLIGTKVRINSQKGVLQWLGCEVGMYEYKVVSADDEYIVIEISSCGIKFNSFFIKEINLFIRLDYEVCNDFPKIVIKQDDSIIEKLIGATEGKVHVYSTPNLRYEYLDNLTLLVGEHTLLITKFDGLFWDYRVLNRPKEPKNRYEVIVTGQVIPLGEKRTYFQDIFPHTHLKHIDETLQSGEYEIKNISLFTNRHYLDDLYSIIRFYNSIIHNMEQYLQKKENCQKYGDATREQIKDQLLLYCKP